MDFFADVVYQSFVASLPVVRSTLDNTWVQHVQLFEYSNFFDNK